jgi:hypothetical protein
MRPTSAIAVLILSTVPAAHAQDSRQLVELPEMMQQHMLGNMRDHLESLDEILALLGQDKPDAAADVAESRLGMSSLDRHGASHMAKFMPENMQELGTNMHRAASRFAITAQAGSVLPAYRALQDITASCVACHAAYRIR